MPPNPLVFVFPAFPNDYTGHPGNDLKGFNEQFDHLVNEACSFHEFLPAGFNFQTNNFLDDELNTQYIAYLYSCAAGMVLREKQLVPEYSAGYSMGLYAALYDAGSITLDTGLRFIQQAYLAIRELVKGQTSGMGTIIGLDRNDIKLLIAKSKLKVDVTNQNAPYSFVVSGIREDVVKLLNLANEEGALHTRTLPVSVPYHYHQLKDAATRFAKKTSQLGIFPPLNPIVSLIDQKELQTPKELRRELTGNLYLPLNWYKTLQWFLLRGIFRFIECGPSKSLVKNAKFVAPELRFFSLDRIH